MGFAALSVFLYSAVESVLISGGEYRPLYFAEDSIPLVVSAFEIDITPVSNAQFFEFVQSAPKWQKNKVASLFTEKSYLKHWQQTDGVWQPDESQKQEAVTNVSWFAAQSYCRVQGKHLPTIGEWEFVASASASSKIGSNEPGYNQRILEWYARPNDSLAIGKKPGNYWGVKDLHGLIWEWTEDFNSNLNSGESRADANIDTRLYCAAGAVNAVDPGDYAAFMRYGFRSSLQARFAISNLGFRCATHVEKKGSNIDE